jgi:hypothetical protein
VTTYRLFPATNGPAAPTPYAGPFLAGIKFGVFAGGMWLNGFYWWVPPGGDTGPQKFALWSLTSAAAGVLVPAATVTSGPLAAGQWNLVPLPAPVQLGFGGAYIAATGWTAASGFPITNAQFGTAGPYVAGLVNGPLTAWSDGTAGGTDNGPWTGVQGLFSVAGADPSVTMPNGGSGAANFWMDVLVSTAPPAGYAGSWRLWPNQASTNSATVPDSPVNYVLATEVHLSQACTLNRVWYYSPAGTAQLATRAAVWSIGSQAEVAAQAAPAWSGAAGSGWVSAAMPAAVLPAGNYKVTVFNSAGVPDGWSAKDAGTSYWGTGAAAAGIAAGPLLAPGLAAASLAYEFNGNAGGTPPYSNGVQEPGQATFWMGPANGYPYLYVDGLAQNYWVDLEVTPSSTAGGGNGPGGGADEDDPARRIRRRRARGF